MPTWVGVSVLRAAMASPAAVSSAVSLIVISLRKEVDEPADAEYLGPRWDA